MLLSRFVVAVIAGLPFVVATSLFAQDEAFYGTWVSIWQVVHHARWPTEERNGGQRR